MWAYKRRVVGVVAMGLLLASCSSTEQHTNLCGEDGLLCAQVASLAERGEAGGTLTPSLAFRETTKVGGGTVPVAWQSGLPVPSFDPQNRPRVSLAGSWRSQRARLNSSITLGTQNLATVESEAAGRHLPGYNDLRWQQKTLPMVENKMPTKSGDSRGPELFEGSVWYRRTFDVPAAWQGQRVTLNLLGANYVVDVWINGRWIGYHEGGYTPFMLDAAKALTYGGSNTVAIRIDNFTAGSRSDVVPARKPDWWNYTGVVQDIYLEAAPALWVARADVRTPDLSGGVETSVVLHNAGAEPQQGTLTLRVREADPRLTGWLGDPRASTVAAAQVGAETTVAVALAPGQALVVPARLVIPNPKLWTPHAPNLYVLEAELTSGAGRDPTAYQFGVRTVRTAGHQLLLNGQPTFLAGIARHEEWPDSGRTASWTKIRTDLQAMKAMGANYLRASHYPNHIYTHLLTDRLGLAAAAEIPVWQFSEVEFQAQATRRIADQMWREMILANANRASLIFWSTNNEPRELPQRTAFNRRLIDDFNHHLQDDRIVIQSAAADRSGAADVSQRDFAVAGWTTYFGVFHGSTYYEGTRQFLADAHAAFPQTPVLSTEFGVWSSGGGSSEARQQELLRETLHAFVEVSTRRADGSYNPDGFLAGITWWTMYDWYSPITNNTKLQTMGLYHMNRTRAKPVAEELKRNYAVWQTP